MPLKLYIELNIIRKDAYYNVILTPIELGEASGLAAL